ncbi:MAG TPA: hypothetical protein VF025_13635 [Gaiellaceae bacterium]
MWMLAPILLLLAFRRRRPLLRGAVLGGTAYVAGKKGAEAAQREAEGERAAEQPPAAGSGGMSSESMEKLKQLAELHEQGILIDAEFEVQEQKILQGM